MDVKACRICFVKNKPLQNLQNTSLGLYFEVFYLGSNIAPSANQLTSSLPPYACGICASLIKKYYFFRERCLVSHNILNDILHTQGLITEESLDLVNTDALKLSLSVWYGPVVDISGSEALSSVETEVKLELNNFIDNEQNLCNDVIKIEYAQNLHEAEIKTEDHYASLLSLQVSSDDDDEPLSLHKKTKEEKGKKKKKSSIKEEHTEIEDMDNDGPGIAVHNSVYKSSKKTKRGRTKKVRSQNSDAVSKRRRTVNTGGVPLDIDDDVEAYATVIQLTLEEQLEEIENRKKSRNYMNSAFKCDQCYKGFIEYDAWKNHSLKHDSSSGEEQCEICKFRFRNKRALLKHVALHERKYSCNACSFVSKTKTQAQHHQLWHKGVTYKCQYCGEILTKWTSYLSHVRIQHRSEHICGICGYSFVSKLGLTMHRTMMHKDLQDPSQEQRTEKSEGDLYCSVCDVQFLNSGAWKRHLATSAKHVNTNKAVGCRECGESFPSAELRRLHARAAHPRPRRAPPPRAAAWPAPCAYCTEMITSAREQWVHFRRAHPDVNYPIKREHVCDICGKSFRGNAFLNYHKRTHTEDRAYKCAQCPKTFFNRANLQMHEKSHSENRPYPCNVCVKAFKNKGALTRHLRCHTGEKPYECEVCGKTFGQSNSRKLHVQTVHLKLPCPYVSRTRHRPKKTTEESEAPTEFRYQMYTSDANDKK